MVVCVLGMHSSGTSAVARIVNLLGVDMGPPEVAAPARRANTKGLWELPRLTRLGERILNQLGGTWDDPPPLPDGWQQDPALDPHRDEAREIVAEAFGDAAVRGWKDPRSSLLLPFWHDLLGPMRHVICVRNPVDVAASLGRRDDMPFEKAVALWERYTVSALADSEGQDRVIVCYEDVITGADDFSGLAELVGRPEAATGEDFRAAVADWLETEMWHHRDGASSEEADARLEPRLRSLYLDLRAASRAVAERTS